MNTGWMHKDEWKNLKRHTRSNAYSVHKVFEEIEMS